MHALFTEQRRQRRFVVSDEKGANTSHLMTAWFSPKLTFYEIYDRWYVAAKA